METILISIISDQTIPNLLLIQELKGKYQHQLFISTAKMEETGKSRWIEQAAGIEPGSTPRIVVDENRWGDISEKLFTYKWPSEANYLVNLTGGTKVMTLAIYDFFARPGNRIIYVPIGKNCFEQIYPDHEASLTAIHYRLNLNEYLLAHGINFSKKDHPVKPCDELKRIYKQFRSMNYDIHRLNADYDNEWKHYFTGTWFEEYLYYRIKRELQLNDDCISMDVEFTHFNQVNRAGNDNELDIVFTLNNELYFAEAKVSIGRETVKKDVLDRILFKLSAINKHFGLRTHAHVITLADTHSRSEIFREDLARKTKVLGINSIIDRKVMNEKGFSFTCLVEK